MRFISASLPARFRGLDVAARGLRIGAKLIGFVDQRLGDVACKARQADIEAGAQEVTIVASPIVLSEQADQLAQTLGKED